MEEQEDRRGKVLRKSRHEGYEIHEQQPSENGQELYADTPV